MTRALHWSVAVLILANLAVGWIGEELERGPTKGLLFQWHMSLGLLVVLLSAVRLAWRWIEPPPPPLTRIRWEAALAKTVHTALLALAILAPLTGVGARLAEGRPVTFLGLELVSAERPVPVPRLLSEARADGSEHGAEGAEDPAIAAGYEKEGAEIWVDMHKLLAKPVLLLLLALHVGGALKHHFLDRDQTLARMLGRVGGSAA